MKMSSPSSRGKHRWPPMNADKNKPFSYRRASAFIGGSIFFAPAPRDSVWTEARPGRSEKVAQSDSSAAPIHRVDLRRSETHLGACRHECLRHIRRRLATQKTRRLVRPP